MRNCPEEFEVKLHHLVSNGLTSRNLAERILQDISLHEICSLLIDFEFSKQDQKRWFAQFEPSLSKDTPKLISQALEELFPDRLLDVFKKNKLGTQQIKDSLIRFASTEKPETIITDLLENDFNCYELFTALSEEPGYFTRRSEIRNLVQKSETTAEVWQAYCFDFPLSEQLALCKVMKLESNQLQQLVKPLGFDSDLFENFRPEILVKHMEKQKGNINVWNDAVLPILETYPLNRFMKILLNREVGRKSWLQTVGPNVEAVYSGVLHQTVPCPPSVFEVPKGPQKDQKLPDFRLVLYQEGVVRAEQVGHDQLVSTEERTFTIGHYYEGIKKEGTIQLKECSSFEASPKRPSLGDIRLENFSIDSSGLVASFQWKNKTIHLNWHAGFSADS